MATVADEAIKCFNTKQISKYHPAEISCCGLISSVPLLAATEKVVPFRSQYRSQLDQIWQGWKVFTGFQALGVTRADTDFLGHLLLGVASRTP